MSYCKIIINGRLTRDVEIKTTPAGKNVAHFSLAYDTGWGEYKKTSFVECYAFGKTGEFICKFFKKGGGGIFEGVLELEQWEDSQTRKTRSKHKVNVGACSFADGNRVETKGMAEVDSQNSVEF